MGGGEAAAGLRDAGRRRRRRWTRWIVGGGGGGEEEEGCKMTVCGGLVWCVWWEYSKFVLPHISDHRGCVCVTRPHGSSESD